MACATFQSSTGVRSYDAIEATRQLELTDVYPNLGGFAAIRLPPQGGACELKVPAVADHAVWMLLRKPTALSGGFGDRARPIAVQLHTLGITPAGTPTTWELPHGDVDVFHMHLSPDRLSRTLGDDETGGRDVALIAQMGITDGTIESIMRQGLAELRQQGPASRALMDSFAVALAVRLLRAHSLRPSSKASPDHAMAPYRLRRAKEFIEAHLAEDIGLEAIATVAGLSTFHFSRSFKKATGLSPYRYLLERRIAHAQSLLATGDLPIAAVAHDCGFGSQQQFTTMFRKFAGATPATWRRRHRP